jgi:hypothetical protein
VIAALFVETGGVYFGISWCGNTTKHGKRRRISSKEASRSPIEFRDTLIAIARSAVRTHE